MVNVNVMTPAVFCLQPVFGDASLSTMPPSGRSSTLADVAVSVVGIGAPARRPLPRQSLLLFALLAVSSAVLASTAGNCPQLPLARVVVFIPPVFRLGQCSMIRVTRATSSRRYVQVA